ncbi:MAG: hypothetical protein H7839_22425 [Magnetococcus sp. YQC-5]
MHAAFPHISDELQKFIKNSAASQANLLSNIEGRLLAELLAQLLSKGFAYIFRPSLLDPHQEQTKRSAQLFEENFVIVDPDGPRYYRGQFLIRTKKQGDEMNLWFRFCPKPQKLYQNGLFGLSHHKRLDPWAVVEAKTFSDADADLLEQDPDKVDLVIRFKDSAAILGLVSRGNADMVGLLLENVVQLSGNVGHLFKLGAIAKALETAMRSPDPE